MDNPTVVVIPGSESQESSQSQSSDGNSETIRLAEEAARAAESNRQVLERLSRMESERETDRARIASLETRNQELIAALEEEEEEGQEEVTVIAPPPPPPPPEPETPKAEEKKKGFFEKLCFGEW